MAQALAQGLLGPMLVGSWMIVVLVVLEFVWTVRYYRQSSILDGLAFRVLVAVTVLLDVAGLFGTQANVYLFCVLHWGDVNSLSLQYWPVPFCFITGMVTVALVQGFFIYRYIKLSKNIIVGTVLGLLGFMALGSGLATAILCVTWDTVEARLLIEIPIKMWLSLDVGTNILISLALIFELYSKRTGLKSTETIVRRFARLTIQSAAIPAACAISALVSYLVLTETNISAIFLWLHPRAYLLSMLYMLNIRRKIREDIRTDAPAYTIGGTHALMSV